MYFHKYNFWVILFCIIFKHFWLPSTVTWSTFIFSSILINYWRYHHPPCLFIWDDFHSKWTIEFRSYTVILVWFNMHAIVQQIVREFNFFRIRIFNSNETICIYLYTYSTKYKAPNIYYYYDLLRINNKMHWMRQNIVCGNLPNMTSSFITYIIWLANFMGKVDRFSFILICIFYQLHVSCYHETNNSWNMTVLPLWCMQNSRASLFLSCRQAWQMWDLIRCTYKYVAQNLPFLRTYLFSILVSDEQCLFIFSLRLLHKLSSALQLHVSSWVT